MYNISCMPCSELCASMCMKLLRKLHAIRFKNEHLLGAASRRHGGQYQSKVLKTPADKVKLLATMKLNSRHVMIT